MESPCLFQINPTESKIPTASFSPNQFINLSASFSKHKFSNIKFFTTATSKKSQNSFLSHKKNRGNFESSIANNQYSTTSESKTFKLSVLNHDILHSYKQNQLPNFPTAKAIYSFKTQSINNSSIAKVFPSSVKKNLMTKLDEKHNHHSELSSKIKKNKVLFTTTGPEEDLEELVDYIISSTNKYTKLNHQSPMNIKPDIKDSNNENNNHVNIGKSCKCKKVGCSKYLCNCLRNGLKCSKSCNCNNCNNK